MIGMAWALARPAQVHVHAYAPHPASPPDFRLVCRPISIRQILNRRYLE
jgi:hypothetical protein